MRTHQTSRLVALLGLLPLLLAGGGCSESTTPVANLPEIPDSYLPREVPGVQAAHGPNPGEAEISWRIINWASFPIEEYLVVMSYEGPITEENWDQTTVLGRFPSQPGRVIFHEIFGPEQNLEQGKAAWFAVRARDSSGRLSKLQESPRLALTREWWLEGRVFSYRGEPLDGVLVTDPSTHRSSLSNEAGVFEIGPFRDIDRVVLEAVDPRGTRYDCTRSPVSFTPSQTLVEGQDFHMLPRFHQDARCTAPDTEFLSYLRRMTLTTPRENNPAASILHRWDHYPLTVHVPSAVNEVGVSMDEAALVAILLWNDVMGEEYFVVTEDQASADIEFHFEDREHFYGLVTLLAPSGPGAVLGRVIPTKMKISIDTELPSRQTVAEVSLHELGHVLGLLNHSECGPAGYLMNIAGGFGVLDKPEPVHFDERQAVACIRYLPQGQDMGAYK